MMHNSEGVVARRQNVSTRASRRASSVFSNDQLLKFGIFLSRHVIVVNVIFDFHRRLNYVSYEATHNARRYVNLHL